MKIEYKNELIKDLQNALSKALNDEVIREYEHLQVRCEIALKQSENELLHSVSYCDCDFKDRDLAKTSHLICNECKKAL